MDKQKTEKNTVPELKIPTTRIKLTLATDMLLNIQKLISTTHEYGSYSDFVRTACAFTLALDSRQEIEPYCQVLLNESNTDPAKAPRPFTIDFKVTKLPEETSEIFVTLPDGLKLRLQRRSADMGIKPSDMLRFCIQFYYDIAQNPIDLIDRVRKSYGSAEKALEMIWRADRPGTISEPHAPKEQKE